MVTVFPFPAPRFRVTVVVLGVTQSGVGWKLTVWGASALAWILALRATWVA